MTDRSKEVAVLKKDLVDLFDHIQRIRREIASIRRPGADEDHFVQMSDELDAIVSATEEATNQIMENAEGIEDLVEQVKARTEDAETNALLDQVPVKTSDIFQACTFQDITGQRITKVVKLLKFVEERVNALISVWGESAIAHEAVDRNDPDAKDPYKRYLHGPQMEGEAISQDEVDAMLAGGGAPQKEKKKHAAPKPGEIKATPADKAEKPGAAKKKEQPAADEETEEKLDQSAIDDLFP